MTRVRMYFTLAPRLSGGANAGLRPVHMFISKMDAEWTEGPRGTRLSDREAQDIVRRALVANEEYVPDEERMFKGEIEEGKIPDGHALCCQFDIRVETKDGKPHFRRTRAERFDFTRMCIPVWETCLDVQEKTMTGLENVERKLREKKTYVQEKEHAADA